MVAEGFTNFATTQLISPSPLNGTALSFTVSSGQGALFPTGTCVLNIDTELILISARSGDTFTVASGGRGYDGTTAASHTVGAIVQLPICAFNVKHLWQNVADTYTPQVPPVQLGGTPSAYDTEFESTGGWILAPSPGGGTVFSINSVLRSHLLLNKGSSDNTLYTAYIPFSVGGSFTITTKIAAATPLTSSQLYDEGQTCFFVSDQTTPSAGADTGNRIRIDLITHTNGMPYPQVVRLSKDTTGNHSSISSDFLLALNSPTYARITYNGSGTWNAYVGNGLVYTLIGTLTGFSFVPTTFGFTFQSWRPSGANLPMTVAIDFVRVVLGSVLPPYGS